MNSIFKYHDPESVLFWNESVASVVGGSKATPSFCILLQHSNRQQPSKTFKVVQPLISAAIFHRNLCQNMSQPKFQKRIRLCITIPQISIACFDLFQKILTDVASIYFATSCHPRLRAEHFWLVRLKLDQALAGWCWLVMPSAAQKLHSADGLQPICVVSNHFWKVSRRTHKCP